MAANLSRNIPISYVTSFLTGLVFVAAIWVAFETRILTFTQIALLHGILHLATIILEVPTGALADLIGRKRTIILGWLTIAIAYLIIAHAPAFFWFAAGYAVLSLGTAFVSGADSALLFDTCKQLKKEEHFSRYMAASSGYYQAALVVGILIGGYLYSQGINFPYLAMAGSHLAAAIVALWFIEPRIDSDTFSLQTYVRQTKIGFKEVFKTAYATRLALFYTLVGGITWSCLTYLNVPFATDVGFSESQLTIIFAVVYLLSASGLWLLARFQVFKRKTILIGFPIIMASALLPGVIATQQIAVILLLLILTAGSGRFVFLMNYVNELYESRYRATAISALNMLMSAFFILIILVSGPIQDIYGTQVIYSVLGLISLFIVLPVAFLVAKPQHKQSFDKHNLF